MRDCYRKLLVSVQAYLDAYASASGDVRKTVNTWVQYNTSGDAAIALRQNDPDLLLAKIGVSHSGVSFVYWMRGVNALQQITEDARLLDEREADAQAWAAEEVDADGTDAS